MNETIGISLEWRWTLNSAYLLDSVEAQGGHVWFPLRVHSWMYWHGHSLLLLFFFFLITAGTLWMVSEFPFHKPYFPWQEQPVKSFGCFWDIFEQGSREQSAATSPLMKAWTSLTADQHNGKPQLIGTASWKKKLKKRKKIAPFRVKKPLKDALNSCFFTLKHPANVLWDQICSTVEKHWGFLFIYLFFYYEHG